MNNIKLTDMTTEEQWEQVKQLYFEAFPKEERKPIEVLRKWIIRLMFLILTWRLWHIIVKFRLRSIMEYIIIFMERRYQDMLNVENRLI